MVTTTVECPFCHTKGDPAVTAGYCDSCGRRLPVSAAYTSNKRGRRLTGDHSDAPSDGGLGRQRTAGVLLTATVLRLVLGGGFLVLAPVFLAKTGLSEQQQQWFLPALMAFTAAGTALYAVLAWLATRAPMPAAVAALVGFLGIWAGVLIACPVAWPLAVVDLILLGCLGYAVSVAPGDRV